MYEILEQSQKGDEEFSIIVVHINNFLCVVYAGIQTLLWPYVFLQMIILIKHHTNSGFFWDFTSSLSIS